MWTYEYKVRTSLLWTQVIQVEAETQGGALSEANRVYQGRLADLQTSSQNLIAEEDPVFTLNFGGPPDISTATVLLHRDKSVDGHTMLQLAQATKYPYIELLGQVFHATPGPNYGKHTGWKYMARQGKFAGLETQDVRMPHLTTKDIDPPQV